MRVTEVLTKRILTCYKMVPMSISNPVNVYTSEFFVYTTP